MTPPEPTASEKDLREADDILKSWQNDMQSSLRDHLATALAAARAEARREALEEAAKICEQDAGVFSCCSNKAKAIRAFGRK